jgi:hypothetical protein
VSDAASTDQLDSSPLQPAQSLRDLRAARYEAHYRKSCEEEHGIIKLGPEEFHPADILDALAKDAARRGRDEAQENLRTDAEEIACEQFPSPFAAPFHAFMYGSSDPLERLLRLRDSWEGLIHLLSALALSEFASVGVPINGFNIRNSEANSFAACKSKDLRTDSLALRIGLIEGVLLRATELSITLEVSKIVPREVVSEVRRLNAIRNGFSHTGTKSEQQAQVIIDEAHPLLRELLVDLSELAKVELFRLRQIKPGSPPIAEVERLMGHAQSRRLRQLDLDPASGPVALAAAPIEGLDRVLARLGPKVIDLCPYFYALNDSTGQRTRVAFFKFKKDSKWTMEVVAESELLERDQALHEAQMARFYALLGGGQSDN